MPWKDNKIAKEKKREYYRKHRGLKRKLKRQEIYKENHNSEISIPDDFGYWFSGFTDGEGCFSIKNNGRNQRWNRTEFNLALRADDEKILREIQKTLQIGTIYGREPSIRALKSRPNSKPQFRLEVFKKADCLKLVYIFEKYPLRSKKWRDFLIWKEATLLINKSTYGEYDTEQMNRLKDKIQKIRQFNQGGE